MAPPVDARQEPLVTRFERACWVLALAVVVTAAVTVGAAVLRPLVDELAGVWVW